MEHQFSGGLVLRDDGAFPLGTDAILLADFARVSAGEAVCDLGCGCGVIGLLLAARRAADVTGVELQPDACETARQNAARNGLTGRFRTVPGDLRGIRSLLPAGTFRAVVSNPPYFPDGAGAAAPGARGPARTELACSLGDVCRAAAWLLRFGGRFFVVYRPERLADLICALRENRLEPKRIRFVRHRPGAPVSLILLEARSGGRAGLRCEPDLPLCGDDGQPSAEARRIYHWEE